QAEDGIRDWSVTGVQTCALPIYLQPLFDAILKTTPAPKGTADGPLQILVANLDYSDYLGRLAIARVFNGTLKQADEASIAKLDRSEERRVGKECGVLRAAWCAEE